MTKLDTILDKLLDYYIDERGCSRLSAYTYAIAALKARRQALDEILAKHS